MKVNVEQAIIPMPNNVEREIAQIPPPVANNADNRDGIPAHRAVLNRPPVRRAIAAVIDVALNLLREDMGLDGFPSDDSGMDMEYLERDDPF